MLVMTVDHEVEKRASDRPDDHRQEPESNHEVTSHRLNCHIITGCTNGCLATETRPDRCKQYRNRDAHNNTEHEQDDRSQQPGSERVQVRTVDPAWR